MTGLQELKEWAEKRKVYFEELRYQPLHNIAELSFVIGEIDKLIDKKEDEMEKEQFEQVDGDEDKKYVPRNLDVVYYDGSDEAKCRLLRECGKHGRNFDFKCSGSGIKVGGNYIYIDHYIVFTHAEVEMWTKDDFAEYYKEAPK